MSYMYDNLKLISRFLFGYILCFVIVNNRATTKHLREAMEIILAICLTGLGIFGGMLVIWNGQNSVPSKAPGTSHSR